MRAGEGMCLQTHCPCSQSGCPLNGEMGQLEEPQSSASQIGLKTKAWVSVVQSLIAEPWINREIQCVKVTHIL